MNIFTMLFAGITWLAATLIGALVGVWITAYLDRRKVIYAAQTEILKWLDDVPFRGLDEHHSDARKAVRGPLFAAIPYLRGRDQRETQQVWSALKTALEGKEDEKNEFLEATSEALGIPVESKEDAFRKSFESLSQTLNAAGRLIG